MPHADGGSAGPDRARRRLRIVARRAYVEPAADALAPLAAPHGVLAVLGNHDDDRDMPAALAAKGFTVLQATRGRD